MHPIDRLCSPDEWPAMSEERELRLDQSEIFHLDILHKRCSFSILSLFRLGIHHGNTSVCNGHDEVPFIPSPLPSLPSTHLH